jgi:hypothetical protein
MTVALRSTTLALTRLPRVPNGTVMGLGFIVCANAACFVGGAGAVTVPFVGGAFVIAVLLARVRPLAALEFALWLWVLGPQVRRMIDLSTGYHEPSLVLLAAPLASLAALPHIRHLRRMGLGRAVRPLLVAAVAIAIGYAVGAVRIGLQPATAALLVWVVPVLFGLQVVAVSDDVAELRATVERFLIWSVLIVGVYGVVQFYVVPPWDAFWMDRAPMNSIGSPEPFQIRVFSTLNSPGPLAAFLAAAVLCLTDARHRLRLPAQIAGYAGLALSLVRAAWIAWLLGVLVVLVAGRPRARTTAVVAVTLITVGALQISGPLQRVVADRIDETREGEQDDSFVARMDLHQEMVPRLLDDVVGHGLGTTGTASTLTAGRGDLAVLDSGLIDFGYSLGLPIGLLALGALTFGGADLARIGLRHDVVSAGVVAGGLSVLVQLLFGNALTGVGGITFFLLWGLAVREILDAQQQPRREAVA